METLLKLHFYLHQIREDHLHQVVLDILLKIKEEDIHLEEGEDQVVLEEAAQEDLQEEVPEDSQLKEVVHIVVEATVVAEVEAEVEVLLDVIREVILEAEVQWVKEIDEVCLEVFRVPDLFLQKEVDLNQDNKY